MTTRTSPPPHAAANAWPLPAAPLRARALTAAAIGCLVVTGLALVLHAWLDTTLAQPIAAAAVFTTMAGIALFGMRDNHPFPRLGPANRVTMMRAILVALAASVVAEPAGSSIAWTLVTMTVIVTTLDGVDGWLARRTRMSSAFGARFDMETDAFFMLVLSILVWRHDKAGAWVIATGLMRYAFVAAGWLWPWLSRPLRPTVRGKTVAVATLVTLGVALAPPVAESLSTLACAIALGTLVWSFAIDVQFLWKSR